MSLKSCIWQVTCRPPWLLASTAALLGSVLRVPVTPLLDSSPWSHVHQAPHKAVQQLRWTQARSAA